MKTIIFILSFLLCCLVGEKLTAQETIFEEKTTIFKTESSFGGGMHTNGLQLTYRYGKYLTGFTKRVFEIEIANIKHPREKKSFYQFDEDVRGYFFGKMNSFFVVRPSIGFQKVIFPKQSIKGVSITYVAQFGPSFGLAKPVYLKIIRRGVNNSREITKEKYDPEIHSNNNILSRSSFFNGVGELKLYPGLFGKFGLHFDYGDSREIIRAAEVGVKLDAFFTRIPIIAFTENRQIYPNLYIAIFFGNKNVE